MRKTTTIGLLTVIALVISACGASGEKQDALKQISVEGGKVELGKYKGLIADQMVYIVTDEDVDNGIQGMLDDYVDYKVVNRAAEDGDYVAFDLKSSVDGEDLSDFTGNGYGTYIGYEDYGPEFDEQLVGAVAGDKKNFSITYAKDFWEETFAGKTVDFEVNINSVEEEIYPDLTDEFVSDELGYDSAEELRDAVKQQLEEENRQNSEYELQNNLIQQIIDGSKFESYSDELYNRCKAEMEEEYSGYTDWFGCETIEEVYSALEMSDADVEKEILKQVYTNIVINAIAQKEKIGVSKDEYQAGIEEYAANMGYEDTAGLEADYGKETLQFWMLQEKVVAFIIENADVTEIETEQTDDEAHQEINTEEVK